VSFGEGLRRTIEWYRESIAPDIPPKALPTSR
jgi:hypothetical protein